ncbi:MAG: nuclear transport factor 2 family protein [Gammaproteobacteria bacterium]|nr:nuclear transport factor 2 family protein [Gammaproteobacteria bacterium]
MNANEQLIHKFYSAFQKLDWQGMQSCYVSDIHFSDPVFNDLKGQEVVAMWHMLCNKAVDFELIFTNIKADDTHGSAQWEASYTFSQTGRRVNNVIFAEFQFSEGKITRHSDHFSFWKWSRMALGPIGMALGWSSYLKNKVHQQGLSGLNQFIKRNHSKKDA